MPAAAAAGGGDAGRWVGDSDQLGEHAEGLGTGQPSGPTAVGAVAAAVAAAGGAERGRDGLGSNGDKRWIWALAASQFVLYTVAAHRSVEVLVSLLGVVFGGILCSDRLPVYLKYHAGKMQLCWAHWKRNLQGILDHPQSEEGSTLPEMPWPNMPVCSGCGGSFAPVGSTASN
jgi:hypothetical protein